jgi:hypothetical protein
VLNVDQPPSIPQRPMGSIPVAIRLVRPDGEEWWPGTANRWTDTHVLVHWVEDEQPSARPPVRGGVATRRGRPPIPEDLGMRQLAFDRTMPPSEALGRIRDAFRDYDQSSKS